MTSQHQKARTAFGYGIFPESEQPVDTTDTAADQGNEDTLQQTSGPTTPRPSTPRQSTPRRADQVDRRYSTQRSPYVPSGREQVSHRYSAKSELPQQFGFTGRRGEPLSLAEVLNQEKQEGISPVYNDAYECFKMEGEEKFLITLEKMSVQELIVEARRCYVHCPEGEHVEDDARSAVIFHLLRDRVRKNGLMFGEGTLEILPDQFGFLRSADSHYLSSADDIYISPSQIRRFGLRPGCLVSGQIRPPKENERYFALLRVEAINRDTPGLLDMRPQFDLLTPVYPNEQMLLSHDGGDKSLRLIDSLIPLGFGQRGLIVGPPKSGKTNLVRKIAEAAMENYPDLYVFVLLIEELPEEATEVAKQLKSSRCEVVCSLFEEPPLRHVHLADIVLEKAKRMVECGRNVLILLDSITKLARAWHVSASFEAQAFSDNFEHSDTPNLQACKKYFSSARKAEQGGSLTILSTVPTETDNEFDETVYSVFRGTGNVEIHLDRDLADRRIWPAIDIQRSGTRHEESILSEKDFQKSSALRRQMANMTPEQALEFLFTK